MTLDEKYDELRKIMERIFWAEVHLLVGLQKIEDLVDAEVALAEGYPAMDEMLRAIEAEEKKQ